MFEGSMVAIVTPMKDGDVDEQSLRSLLRSHLKAGTAGIVPTGCTGEAATLSVVERARVLDVCLEEVGGSMPVVPGTGSNSTRETVNMSAAAEKAGASGVLIITPYYNKPTPEGQYVHYRTVAEHVDLPIILYNVPSRTGVNMTPETVARLSELRNVVAIKEAAGSVDQVSAILELCDITVLSGDDPLTLPMMAVGADGVVSVLANVLPRLVAEMVGAYPDDAVRARELHRDVRALSKALFIETNPGPVKYVLAQLGLIDSDELRPPLAGLTTRSKETLVPIIDRMRSGLSG